MNAIDPIKVIFQLLKNTQYSSELEPQNDIPLYKYYLRELYHLSGLPATYNIKNEYFDAFFMKRALINLIFMDDYIDYNDDDDTPILTQLNNLYTNPNEDLTTTMLPDILEWFNSYTNNPSKPDDKLIKDILLGVYKPITKGEGFIFDSGIKYVNHNVKLIVEYKELIKAFIPLLENFVFLFFPPQYWPIFTYNFIIKNLVRYKDRKDYLIDYKIGNRFFDTIDEKEQETFLAIMIPLRDNSLYNKLLSLRYETLKYSDMNYIKNSQQPMVDIKNELLKKQRDFIDNELYLKNGVLRAYIKEQLINMGVQGLNNEWVNKQVMELEMKAYNAEPNSKKKLVCESMFRFSHNTPFNNHIKSFIPQNIQVMIEYNFNMYTANIIKKTVPKEEQASIFQRIDNYITQKERKIKVGEKEENQIYIYYRVYELSSSYTQFKKLKDIMDAPNITRKIDPTLGDGYKFFTMFMKDYLFSDKYYEDEIDKDVYNFFNNIDKIELKITETEKETRDGKVIRNTVVKYMGIDDYIFKYTLNKIDLLDEHFIRSKYSMNKDNKIQYQFHCKKMSITQSWFYNDLLSLVKKQRLYH